MALRHPGSHIRRGALALATLVVASLAFAAPAAATTETFNYTGAAQTWTVPAGVTSATFDLYGAEGGGYSSTGFASGLGGRATATIGVTPGESIQVNVGGKGAISSDASGGGGFNGGGGVEAGSGLVTAGGGGGGASDIRIGGVALANRVLVAGGGGGSGSQQCGGGVGVAGGSGGGLSGDAGGSGGCSDPDKNGGGGGTQIAGGAAGGGAATAGSLGLGGDGDRTPLCLGCSLYYSSGGGGGGYYGGGGGQKGSGGGGGSGYGPASTVFQTGVRSGNGVVTVTYTAPLTIADLIDSVNALNLAKGTKTSLLQKLNGAQKNLNSGDTGGACDKLASFISQVKALRGKKIIPVSAADQLIADARAVRAFIGCG